LIRSLKRAKELVLKGQNLVCSDALRLFLERKIDKDNFDRSVLDIFAKLDDVDILAALKAWQDHPDFVLSRLCRMIIERRLLKIKLKDKPIDDGRIKKFRERFKGKHSLTEHEAGYFVFTGTIENQAYDQELQNIDILRKNGKLVDVAKASDQLNLKALSKKVVKYYVCYPKESRQ